MTPGVDNVAILDAEQDEKKVELFVAIWTKMNSRKWMKIYESQFGKLAQLQLKPVVFHDDRDKEIHMIQSVGFIAAYFILVDSLDFQSSFRWITCGLIPWVGGM